MTHNDMRHGLTSQEVAESRRLHGSNVLTPPKKTPLWVRFLEKFEDPIIRILLFAWVLAIIIAAIHCWGPDQAGWHAFIESLGILFAIILASSIGFIFEVKAANAFDVLNKVNDNVPVTVIRDGRVTETTRADIVVGDTVMLGTGDEIPADGVLCEAVSMQVNESTLTGEPMVCKTTSEKDFEPDATYPSNHVMRGTTVMDGHGIMQVTAVGDATEYGKVNHGAQMDNSLDTPLQIQLKRLAIVISRAGYAIAFLTFMALTVKVMQDNGGQGKLFLAEQILNNFMIAVTMVVVSVPEGLPMSVTLSLALSMNRMLRADNLVRKMHACETMGAATVICTDKTGTLTQNCMHVNATTFPLPTDSCKAGGTTEMLIYEGIAVNSTANLSVDEGKTVTIGNPTEAAMLLWLDDRGKDYSHIRSNTPVVSQLTFSTERKYMATVVNSHVTGRRVLYVKGAPEIVLDMCGHICTKDGDRQLYEVRNGIDSDLLAYQNRGMRTLGFAYKMLTDDEADAPYCDGRLAVGELTFLGIAAIADPVREDVPEAVRECMEAGIDIKIVTGDTPATAREVAKQIGVWTDNNSDADIITGTDFAALDDDDAAQRAQQLKIMCRARPADKQRLVQLLQSRDAVVAVTGDGTNDAPALKAAHVGLSMGDGTSVAKEASDITILNNSFSGIVQAVMWGRSLYRNIQRFLLFQLTINVAASAVVFISALLGMGSPLTIAQMLWVNLIMDTFAAGALASLPPNRSVMLERPRRSGTNGDFIISRPMAHRILGIGTLFTLILLAALLYMQYQDDISDRDLSRFFTFFVMLQVWNMFNTKAFMTNRSTFADIWQCKAFLGVILAVIVGQFLITNFGGTMFHAVPLSATEWTAIIALSMPVLLLGEAERMFLSAKRRK